MGLICIDHVAFTLWSYIVLNVNAKDNYIVGNVDAEDNTYQMVYSNAGSSFK